MIRQPTITISRLNELVDADFTTGILTWRARCSDDFPQNTRNPAVTLADGWNRRWAGKPALNIPDQNGYLRGRLLGEKYRAHQVIWALANGRWPAGEIDHINGVKADNRPVNLREVTSAENNRNRALRRTNKTGTSGVFFSKADGRYIAQIHYDGRLVYLGGFLRLEDAVAVRKAAEAKLGYHENHGRKV